MWKTYEERFPYIIAFRHELPYFQLSGSHFSRFWRPAGKQVFSVIATVSSSKPSKTCNPLLLLENQICRVPLMSAYVYQMGVSLVEAKGSDADINIKTGDPEFSAWKWVCIERLPELIVPFKRHVYLSVLNEFCGPAGPL